MSDQAPSRPPASSPARSVATVGLPAGPASKVIVGWRPYFRGSRALLWIGVALLVVWSGWLLISLTQKPLPRAVPFQRNYLENRFTYILLEPFIGLDFHHNYVATRMWRERGDPYAQLPGDPANARYTYPPLTMVAFAWTDLFPPGPVMTMTGTDGKQSNFATSKPAILLWLTAIIAVVAFAGYKSWWTRSELGLPPLALPFILGATLISYPVIFEIERANCNAIPLLAIALLAAIVRRAPSLSMDVLAGACIAVATGVKPYAAVLLVGMLAFRRYRAAALGVGWLVLQAIILSPDLRRWLAAARIHSQGQSNTPLYLDFSHSVIAHWQLIARDLKWPALAQWSPTLVVALIVIAVVMTVSWRVFRRGAGTAIAWPYLLWLAAMATMISPIAQDYNLLFIPLAVLSAWSARDSWLVQLCAALVLLWWQPFFIGIVSLPWLLLKVISVMLVGVIIMRRVATAPKLGAMPDRSVPA